MRTGPSPLPIIDAKIIEITKEVRVKGAEGMMLAGEIKKALGVWVQAALI